MVSTSSTTEGRDSTTEGRDSTTEGRDSTTEGRDSTTEEELDHRGVDWDASYAAVRAVLLETFATTYSRALQETLHAMGRAVLEAHDDIAEISFVAPNRHHFPVDLAPFGLENNGEVFIAADRPYGLIEATVRRDG